MLKLRLLKHLSLAAIIVVPIAPGPTSVMAFNPAGSMFMTTNCAIPGSACNLPGLLPNTATGVTADGNLITGITITNPLFDTSCPPVFLDGFMTLSAFNFRVNSNWTVVGLVAVVLAAPYGSPSVGNATGYGAGLFTPSSTISLDVCSRPEPVVYGIAALLGWAS